MYIRTLRLKQFRNYDRLDLQVENKVNLILGENAQGKTNLMEAIYMLAFAKSHRTANDKELIQWNQDFAVIDAELEKKNGHATLGIVLSSKGKKTKINHLEQQKLSDFVGTMNVVMFAPEDLHLIKGGPRLRRRFIDMGIGQISTVYLHDLSLYQRILKQRNQLLKSMFPVPQEDQEIMLDILSEQLSVAAAKVIERRFAFLRLLEKWSREIHEEITRQSETLTIRYQPSCNVSEEMDLSMIEKRMKETLERDKQQEIRRGLTLTGPHRDDMSLFINGKEVQVYGSQGQQRTVALSLKLAEIELIYDSIGEYPILLLDDVLSELDHHRQTHLLNAIQSKVQTFVTTTSVDGIEHQTLQEATTFYAKEGTLTKMK
ncbi:DNA replication/repair protein RecF [Aliibacillus thermotolerans]|mgnify:FL=1|uniref:DNA replication and repair protein RecF n=1 Tax=Aliibacillus thermotolerans TaxID=1834418 RepID=A0ABW0U624_9BACI|nr:DNA replication/repair protein RecF [Aliibacillus thermotolerans]MDA3129308.1 DNA replication/repair protein RecF [Aliibacillus thermotolerans]